MATLTAKATQTYTTGQPDTIELTATLVADIATMTADQRATTVATLKAALDNIIAQAKLA